LKRFFLRLDPAKLQAQAATIETDLAAARRSIAAGAAKLADFRIAIDRAQAEKDRDARESRAMLVRHSVDPARLSARIAQLSKQAEDLTAAIRAIEAELEALLAKILREAKV